MVDSIAVLECHDLCYINWQTLWDIAKATKCQNWKKQYLAYHSHIEARILFGNIGNVPAIS